ncbi:MAG TPA: M56 family metallopeptidase, partial [Gemmatimonadaceae bacterium]
EWATRGRGPTRHFWTAAILLALLAPPGVLGWHEIAQRSSAGQANVTGTSNQLPVILVNAERIGARRVGSLMSRDALIRSLIPSRRAALAQLSRANRRLAGVAITAWAFLSLALIAWLMTGVFHWRRVQRAWQRTTVDGVDVDVSPLTGPAVLGFLSHRIVLPTWATTMQPEHRRLILAHECEHIEAHDPERLAFAIAVLILMPWNIGMWWCAARLRRSIELDCDARVLRRFPNAKEYGYVLLEVAARGRNTGALAIPMVGLLRLPSELELRLRAMTRVRTVGVRGAVCAGIAAVIAVAAAFAAPVPSLHVLRGQPTAGTMQLPRIRATISDTGSRQRQISLLLLRRERDSLLTVTRELAARERELSVTRARLDSMYVALRLRSAELRAEKNPPLLINPGSSANRYFEFHIDKPAAQLPGSSAPIYPDSLRHAGVSGRVDAQFVVDTAGRVVPKSIKILNATDPLFGEAVRSALPRMRFSPAELRGKHVRQLMKEPFVFAVTDSVK